jgi:serine/threonine protein kinase
MQRLSGDKLSQTNDSPHEIANNAKKRSTLDSDKKFGTEGSRWLTPNRTRTMSDSLEQLSKSQLFDLKGQIVDVTLNVGSGTLSTGEVTRQLNEVIIDQKYKIISLLGEGGMGAVYKAQHLMLGKEVALKTFRSPNLTDDSWKRFQREAQALARLSHVNIVQVFDFGVGEDDVPYYTMECLPGESLADRLAAKGPLPLNQTIRLFLQVCDGLSMAHHKGVIHRDIKPANVFLTTDATLPGKVDLVKIVDFGIAGLATSSPDGQRLTTAGKIFGSPLYMSPEQSLGIQLTERSDIYSCGCTIFETLTGRPPFRGDNAFATMLMHQQSPVPQLNDLVEGKPFPQQMNALIAKMLAKEEGERFQSFEEVSTELEDILKGDKLKPAPGHKDSSSVPPIVLQGLKKESASVELSAPKLIALIIFIMFLSLVTAAVYWYRQQKAPAKVAIPHANALSIQPPVKSTRIAPYLQEPDSNRPQDRRFVFPPDKSLGQIKIYFDKAERDKVDRTGTQALGTVVVEVPPHGRLHLLAGDALSADPTLFEGFGANDLGWLTLNPRLEWNNRHISYISKLTGLDTLRINEADVNDECIADLNKLTNLRNLSVGQTPLPGAALTKLKRLPYLEYFEASGIKTISTTLKSMTNCRELRSLLLDECNLVDDDMKVIGKLSNLERLHLNGNSQITDHGLQFISNLQQLHELYISRTGISPNCLGTLKKLRALTGLTADTETCSSANLQKGLPNCKIPSDRKNED